MSRVEWTRHPGDDVEAVVAMFVNRERPNSVRITPSRGDGGVDILDRHADPDGGDHVYQVKAYCDRLTSRQKLEVKTSLDALIKDPRWALLKVTTWYLVTPWDPTPEAEKWLQDLTAEHSFTAIWHGLAYVEQLAAKHHDVVDYYLHGGRGRVTDAYNAVSALFSLGGSEQFDVPAVTARIEAAMTTLDTDPHYRYELRVGDHPAPPPADRPGLVMTWISGRDGGRWVAVDVIARCAASVQVRPIVIDGRFAVESGSNFDLALHDFAAYGTPFTSPAGAFEGELDAPGGLGGLLRNAQITTFSLDDDLGTNPQLHAQIIDPGGTILSAVDLDRIERTQGTEGVRVVLEETHHVFQVEDRYNLSDRSLKRDVRPINFTGQPAITVLPALRFLSACRTPNVARVCVRHTPPERGRFDPAWGLALSAEAQRSLDGITAAVEALAVIQQHTSVLIRVPDLGATAPAETHGWLFAARLLRGDEVWAAYPEGSCLLLEFGGEVEVPDDGTLGVALPLTVQVGGQPIGLGKMEVWLSEAVLVRRQEHEGHIFHAFTTPDRRYRYQLAGDGDDG